MNSKRVILLESGVGYKYRILLSKIYTVSGHSTFLRLLWFLEK